MQTQNSTKVMLSSDFNAILSIQVWDTAANRSVVKSNTNHSSQYKNTHWSWEKINVIW